VFSGLPARQWFGCQPWWLKPVFVDSCFRINLCRGDRRIENRSDYFRLVHTTFSLIYYSPRPSSRVGTTMEPPLRPTMRRKSSASTLLSSFQGSRAGAAIPNNVSLKEWETASSSSDGTVTVATGGSGGTTLVPSSSTESLREALSRRILAIAHIRQSYEGFVIE
jgi:hypothetical protein